jgi:GTP-binding protein HflX
LSELGVKDKQTLTVFNKIDNLWDPHRIEDLKMQYPGALFLSAHSGEGIDILLERIQAIIEAEFAQIRLLIPHERYDLVARLHREGSVRKEESRDDGTYLVSAIPERLQSAIKPYILEAGQA